MNPVKFDEANGVIGLENSTYQPLIAYREQNDGVGRVVCCWKLTLRERIKVLFIGKVWHHILTFNQPLQPQLLMVEKPEMRKKL